MSEELSAKQRRAALEVLPRDGLGQIAVRFELEAPDRRVAANHADAIVRARRVEFAELLGLLSRDELKAMCAALGRDTGGREDRILSVDGAKGSGKSMKATAGKVTQQTWSTSSVAALHLDANAKLMREQFEGYRRAAAESLRGSVGRSDSKSAQRPGEDESP
jgi:hypothetical protein